MGDSKERRTREIDALRLGVSCGMTLIDTAELYAAGRSERIVGEAVADLRDQVFLVSKVWPSHAAQQDAVDAAHASLERLGTDRLDALLLHWPTRSVPLNETLRAFRRLHEEGTVRYFGVSNFDAAWLRQLAQARKSEDRLLFNQVAYSLGDRRVEHSVLEASRTQGLVAMAYSPLAHGRHAAWRRSSVVQAVAKAHEITPVQVALAWLAHQGVIAIPKAVSPEHVRENAAAADIELGEAELTRLDAAFPRSRREMHPVLPPYKAFHRLVLRASSWATKGT